MQQERHSRIATGRGATGCRRLGADHRHHWLGRTVAMTGALLAALLMLNPAGGWAKSNLLPRFPTLHGNDVVFEAAGNLWSVARQGGTAVRLTSDRGYDMMPRFSPDGKWIAFTGQYDNSTDVFVIPAEGGVARRLTYHSDVVDHAQMRWGPDNMVVTWTPDSKKIIFLSRRTTFNDWFGQLFEVPVTGGLPQQLAVPKGGVTSFNADGTKIAYNRIFRNFRTWKRYTGGLAQDVWIYDFKSHDTTRVTDWKGTDTYPMWDGNTIYFASDRGPHERLNLWAYDLGTHQFRQVTHFSDYDIDWPSLGNDGIVFQQGGSLYVLDLPSEKLHELTITVPADGVRTRVRWADASKQIRDYDLAPNGKRALFAARGDIFTAPAEHGNTRDLTQTSNADERYPSWSPDGHWVAYATDANGEQELAIRPADGSGHEELVTNRKEGYFYTPAWSPDSKKLAVSDNEHRLMFVDIASKKLTQVAHDPDREIHDYTWSPDSRWIAYSLTTANRLRSVYLYSLESGKSTQVTSNLNADGAPAFSQDGKYLFFVSGRHENATFSESEFNIATLDMDGIYVLTLQAGEKSPFAPRSDEGALEKKGENGMKNGAKAEKKNGKSEAKPITIDLAGIEQRVDRVPIPSANIGGLFALKGKLLYSTRPNQTIQGPLSGESSALHVYDLEKRKDEILVEGPRGFAVSNDGSTVMYREHGKFFLIKVSAAGGHGGHGEPISVSGLRAEIDPVAEWHEMFHDAWRLERDFFFNRKMNGVDWNGVREHYAKLLPELGTREDLNYVIGQMIGELSNSHTYVGDGDMDFHQQQVRAGMLGADFGLDEGSGRYYFKKIYAGDNSRREFRSPLTEPGIDVKQGDFLLAIDGHELTAPTNPYQLLLGTLGKTVTLTVAKDAKGAGRHDVEVRPIHDGMSIRLEDWIAHNRERVAKESGGKLGYIYLSDMSAEGMNQFIRQFYPQLDKQGLVVDVRWNGGGFIDQIVLERLRRVLVGMETNRQRVAGPIPNQIIPGPMACILNHYSASDGDIFPFYFKKYGLGPLIGERSWGGVRGIRGGWPLLDGGYITIPEASLYGLDSHWVIENHGVEPDVVVDNLPGDVMAGRDPQLDKAVEVLMKELEKRPGTLPPAPPLLPAYPSGPGK